MKDLENEETQVYSEPGNVDGVGNELVIPSERPKGTIKKVLIAVIAIAVAAALITVLALCIYNEIVTPDDQYFEVEGGLSIVLTEDFKRMESGEFLVDKYDAVFDSPKVAVFVLHENTMLRGEDMYFNNVKLYARALAKANDVTLTEPQTDGELVYFVYNHEDPTSGVTYHYTTFVYGGEGEYWAVQFATPKSDRKVFEEYIKDWARSVVIE